MWLENHPAVAAALASGAVTVEHVRVIADTVRTLPKDLPDDGVAACEAFLLDAAAVDDANALRRRCVELLARLVDDTDNDHTEDTETAAVDRRELWLNSTAVDGLVALRGRLDAEAAELLRAALSPLSAPRPEADGEPDGRSAPKRTADALVELVGRACEHRCVPGEGYTRPHITLTVDAADLTADPSADGLCPECAARAETESQADEANEGVATEPDKAPQPHRGNDGGAGVGSEGAATAGVFGRRRSAATRRRGLAQLTHLGPLSRAAARRLACDAELTPITLDEHLVPLDVGRSTYTVTGELRRALTARDHGCAFPGCGRPPGWCHAHHITHWADGGPTALDQPRPRLRTPPPPTPPPRLGRAHRHGPPPLVHPTTLAGSRPNTPAGSHPATPTTLARHRLRRRGQGLLIITAGCVGAAAPCAHCRAGSCR